MIPYDLPPYFMLSWMFLYGAVIGSFLTVCVHRLPLHSGVWAAWRSLVNHASHCDHCQQKLLARDNIPIFGWLILGGRCRFCKTGIPVKYPLIELANGVLFAALYAMEVPLNYWNPLSESCLSSTLSPLTFDNAWGLSPLVIVNCRYFYHLVLLEMLFVASLIDWDTHTVPAAVPLPALFAGVIGAACFGQLWLVPVWFQDVSLAASLSLSSPATWNWSGVLLEVPDWIGQNPHWHGLAVSLTGIAVGGSLGWTILVVGKKLLGRDVLRFGDVLLLATVGSFLGWQPVAVVILFMAPLVTFFATSVRRRLHPGQYVRYATCLTPASVVVLLSWRWIWPDLEQVFSMGPLLVVLALGAAAGSLPAMAIYQQLRQRPAIQHPVETCA